MRSVTVASAPPEVGLDDLALFVALCEAGSFTRAAVRLRLNKSTVSRRLDALEARIDTRLVERTTHHVKVTEAGEPFLRRATQILEDARDLTRTMSEVSGSPRGLLKITATDVIARALAVPAAVEYLERYPGTRVQIVATQERLDILADDVDLALRIGPLADSSLVARSFGTIATGLFASPDYLARRGIPKAPADLLRQGHRFVLTLEAGRVSPFKLAHKNREIEVAAPGTMVVNSVVLAREAALAGGGIARLPRFLAAAEVTAGTLATVLPRWSAGGRTFHALFTRTAHIPPKVRAFLDLLAARFALSLTWK